MRCNGRSSLDGYQKTALHGCYDHSFRLFKHMAYWHVYGWTGDSTRIQEQEPRSELAVGQDEIGVADKGRQRSYIPG
jgi:hypothetical protein